MNEASDAALADAAPADGRWHQPWGVTCEASLPDHLVTWVNKYWRAYLAEAAPNPIVVTLGGLAASPVIPSGGKVVTRSIEGEPIACRIVCRINGQTDGQTLWLGNEAAGARLILSEHLPCKLDVWGHEPGPALFLGLHEVFAVQGWFEMHAGVVRWPAEQITECLLGRSGAGKSCAVQAALNKGALPLGEDTVWVQAETGLVVPTSEVCRLLPNAFALMPWLPKAAAKVEPDGKLSLRFNDLGRKLQKPSSIDRVTALKNYQPSGDRAVKVQALWEAFRMPMTAGGRTHLQRLVNRLVQL